MEEVVISGGKRTRTADILLAKQVLYQLSYNPENPEGSMIVIFRKICFDLFIQLSNEVTDN